MLAHLHGACGIGASIAGVRWLIRATLPVTGFSDPAAVASRDSASTVGAPAGLRGPSLSLGTARSLGGGGASGSHLTAEEGPQTSGGAAFRRLSSVTSFPPGGYAQPLVLFPRILPRLKSPENLQQAPRSQSGASEWGGGFSSLLSGDDQGSRLKSGFRTQFRGRDSGRRWFVSRVRRGGWWLMRHSQQLHAHLSSCL